MSQIDAEMAILAVLKTAIIMRGVSPCILELVYSKVCTGIEKAVSKMAPDCTHLANDHYVKYGPASIDKIFCHYVQDLKGGLAHDKFAFLVLEECTMTLTVFLETAIKSPIGAPMLKSFLFMIIYTLHCIYLQFPKFRHYDLHTDNIMLKFDQNFVYNIHNPEFIKITTTFPDGSTRTYYVPFWGIIPKIIDFGFSVLPEKNIISNIIHDKVKMFDRTESDIIFLLFNIYHTHKENLGSHYLVAVVEDLLTALDPNEYYKHHNATYLRTVKLPTVNDMLQNAIFDEYLPKASTIYAEYSDVGR